MTVLDPMTVDEFSRFLDEAITTYAADKVASGQWAATDSLELARQSFDELLPQGLATPGHRLSTVRDADGTDVGVLWTARQDRGGQAIAYVYNIRIRPEHQRRGHASSALLALERELPAMGLSGIGLHVFGHNAGAQALYAKLGYVPTNIVMYKAVGSIIG